MIAPTSAARKRQSPRICPGKVRMFYTVWSRTTLGKYTRTGRNRLQKSRLEGMTKSWYLGYSFHHRERANRLSQQWPRVSADKSHHCRKLDSDDRASRLAFTAGS
jgi:hypothetical protein